MAHAPEVEQHPAVAPSTSTAKIKKPSVETVVPRLPLGGSQSAPIISISVEPGTQGYVSENSIATDDTESSARGEKKKRDDKGKTEATGEAVTPVFVTPVYKTRYVGDDDSGAEEQSQTQEHEEEPYNVPSDLNVRSSVRADLFGAKDKTQLNNIFHDKEDVVIFQGSDAEENKLFSLKVGDDTLRFHRKQNIKEIPAAMRMIADAIRVSKRMKTDLKKITIPLNAEENISLCIDFAENKIRLEYKSSEIAEKQVIQRFKKPLAKIIGSLLLVGVPIELKDTFQPATPRKISASGYSSATDSPRNDPNLTPRIGQLKLTKVKPKKPGDKSDEEGDETDEEEATFSTSTTPIEGVNTPRAKGTPRSITTDSPLSSTTPISPTVPNKEYKIILPPDLSTYTFKDLNAPGSEAELSELKKLQKIYANLKIGYLNLKRQNAYNPRDPEDIVSKRFINELGKKLDKDKPNWFFRLLPTQNTKAYKALVLEHHNLDAKWIQKQLAKEKPLHITTLDKIEDGADKKTKRDFTEEDKTIFENKKNIRAYLKDQLGLGWSTRRLYFSVFDSIEKPKDVDEVKFNIARHNLATVRVRSMMSH